MNPQPIKPRSQPHSLSDLFLSFTILALQGFGGVVAIVQREMVERKRWMTQEEFVEDWAVAQVMPGPNVVNLSMMIGARYFGLRGALAALAGMLTVPLILVVLLALVYAQYANHPGVAGAGTSSPHILQWTFLGGFWSNSRKSVRWRISTHTARQSVSHLTNAQEKAKSASSLCSALRLRLYQDVKVRTHIYLGQKRIDKPESD